MAEPAYPPAARVAPIVHERLSLRHRRVGSADLSDPTEPPIPEVIERLVEAAFWASLRREEGRSPTISLAFLPLDRAEDALIFERPVPLVPRALTRLAPAVRRPGIHLGVQGRTAGDLEVWGATRSLPDLSLVVEVVEPGVTVLKFKRPFGHAKFGNLAVLEGESVRVVDEAAIRRAGCGGMLGSLLGTGERDRPEGQANVLLRFALSMRAVGHGGTLLVVPSGGEWRSSLVEPIPYRVEPPFARLADLVRRTPGESARAAWLDDVQLAVDGLAGLTAVDGATVMTTDFELVAFGAKIQRVGDAVRKVMLLEPVVGRDPEVVDVAELGGTRHLSAAQFVHDHHDTVALVASHDGRFTVFDWSTRDDRVHAHRIDTLLL